MVRREICRNEDFSEKMINLFNSRRVCFAWCRIYLSSEVVGNGFASLPRSRSPWWGMMGSSTTPVSPSPTRPSRDQGPTAYLRTTSWGRRWCGRTTSWGAPAGSRTRWTPPLTHTLALSCRSWFTRQENLHQNKSQNVHPIYQGCE